MKRSLALLSCLLVAPAWLSAQDLHPYVVADFETGPSGFEGKISQDKTAAKSGAASGKIDADFSNVAQSAWVTAKRPLDLKNEVRSLTFWVKTSDAKQLTVRIDDSTKQVFQLRPPIIPNGEWQQINIESFEAGPGFQSYGGAADKKVHWPITALHFILEKNGLDAGKTAGSLLVDQVELQVVGAPKVSTPGFDEAIQGLKPTMISNFEEGVSGLNGPIERDASVAKEGKASGKIQADLANVQQSAWKNVTKPLDFKYEIKAASFWLKSAEAKQITVRIIDSTGQTLQVRPALKPGEGWQQVKITSFESGPGFQAYGGAADKKVHWPVKSLAFIVEKNGLEGGNGTVWLDAVELYLGTERVVGKLDIIPEQLGNVFHTGEPVRIGVDTQGDQVAWKVTDFWGKELGQGTTPVKDKRATIEPKVDRQGYFEMSLNATLNGAPMAEGVTSFVIVTPFDLANVQDSPFGVMTHFAQAWNVDIMPILARSGVKNIRDELYWAHVEPKKGEFVFPEKFEKYMAEAKAANVEPLIALTFGNPNYDHTEKAPGYGNAPYTDEGRAGYARYGQEILKHYGSQLKSVEIWNEYNGTFGKGPAAQDKPRYYFEMLKVAHAALKSTRPDVKVVGISAVATPFPYFEDLFKRGALQYMDALSLHPYRTQSTPEGLDRQLGKLQELIKKYNNGKPMPIWITELGWYVKGQDQRSDVIVTEADQAKYLVRAITLTLSAGVEKFYWYHARDDQSFPSSGILRGPDDAKGKYAPKPSYAAYATMTRQLKDAKFETREMTTNEEVYSMRFQRGTEQGRVMWSLKPITLTVDASEPLTVVDLVGGGQSVQPAGSKVKLELTDTPIYVWGDIASLPPMEKSAGQLVADSEEEFSSQQGDDGWSYGYFIAPAPGGPYAPADWKPLPEYRTTIWGYEWIGTQKHLLLGPTAAHPAVEAGKPVWAVRRWTSDVTGNVRLKGRFGRPEKGDGTTARIYVDGKEVWKQQVGGGQPSTVKFDFTATVSAGAAVDIAVDPGPGADTSFDATSSSIKITHLP